MKTEIKAILAEYKGKVLENEHDIWIESNNELTNYYTTGEVCMQRKVKCKVGVGFYHKKPLIFAKESSYQILGGRYGQPYSAETLREQLEYYGFKKEKQRSMFNEARKNDRSYKNKQANEQY